MAKTKYIIFTAGVNSATASKLKEAISQAVRDGVEHIYFLISSGGGDIFEGLSVAAIIKALPMPTTLHNIGQVDSVATAIFSAGKTRVSNQNASFMFHGVSMNLNQGGFLEQQLKELYDSSKRFKADIAKAISTYTGIALVDIENLMVDGGGILNTEEANRKGFITKVVEAQIPQGADVISIRPVAQMLNR